MLWFAPAEPWEKHNVSEKVTFKIKWKTVFDTLGPNMYIIGREKFQNACRTRILLTNKNYDKQLIKVVTDSFGSPVMRSCCYFQTRIKCFCRSNHKSHQTHFAIDVDSSAASWFFTHNEIFATNDSNAYIINQTLIQYYLTAQFTPYEYYFFNSALNESYPYPVPRQYSNYILHSRVVYQWHQELGIQCMSYSEKCSNCRSSDKNNEETSDSSSICVTCKKCVEFEQTKICKKGKRMFILNMYFYYL